MAVELYEHQLDAVKRLKAGKILCGGTGSGKTITSLYFYKENYLALPLAVITTAKKRDSHDWEREASLFEGVDIQFVDSWNNIKKYLNYTGYFFIFDEAKACGSGPWAKAFVKIATRNKWVMLSATPGDRFFDYWAVWVANGYFRNLTDFTNKHVTYKRYVQYPAIDHDHYVNEALLNRYRREVVVMMADQRTTKQHHMDIVVKYDQATYKSTFKNWWDPYKQCPIPNAANMCYVLMRIVNDNYFRIEAFMELLLKHKKAIVFYSYDYELDILRKHLDLAGIKYGELNGHRHDPLPEGERWAYLVNYRSGSEAWNCITCDTLIFYSQSYSYKDTIQAAGRIDRINTPYVDLYYYHLKTLSSIDISIARVLKKKEDFNETKFLKRQGSKA